jgi:rubrerythrin
MGIFISGSELIEIAVGIEKNGAAYYDSLAESTKEATARDLYKDLADKERHHIKTFQSMLSQIGDYKPPETYTEEYDRYLKALIDSSVFKDDQTAREMAQKVASEVEAIQIGLGAEKDSILFYTGIRELVRRSERDVIDGIIKEEQYHLKQLSDLKSKISG